LLEVLQGYKCVDVCVLEAALAHTEWLAVLPAATGTDSGNCNSCLGAVRTLLHGRKIKCATC
jgi:hypothetical protein